MKLETRRLFWGVQSVFARLRVGTTMKKFFAAAVTAVATLAIGTAQAAVLDLTNRVGAGNFTSTVIPGQNGGAAVNVYSGVPNPQNSNPLYMKVGPGSLIIKITGTPSLTNANEGAHPDCAATTGLTCDTDGLGMLSDEITTRTGVNQSVTVEFLSEIDGTAIAVDVRALSFLDLFFAPGTAPGDLNPLTNQESAIAEFNGPGGATTVTTLGTSELTANGLGYEETLTFVGGVTSIVFRAGLGQDDRNGDFALAAITFDAPPGIITPIPGAIPLFLAGLAGLAAARRRRS